MVSKDKTIEQLLAIHARLVRIAYRAADGSDEVLAELAGVARLKDSVVSEYEDSK